MNRLDQSLLVNIFALLTSSELVKLAPESNYINVTKHLTSRINQASWGMVLPPLGSSPYTRGVSSSSIYIVSRIPDTSKQEPTTITIQIIQPQAAMHPVQINMRV